MSESRQCPYCIHYLGTPDDRPDTPICVAFPDGIPEGILTGDIDHSKPVEGDGGIRFEPVHPGLADDGGD